MILATSTLSHWLRSDVGGILNSGGGGRNWPSVRAERNKLASGYQRSLVYVNWRAQEQKVISSAQSLPQP